jgi:arginase family enzyme
LGKIPVADIGDLEVVPGSFELTAQRIKDTLEEIALEKAPLPFLLAVGGNHSITLPICESLKPRTIVVLDAHADCRADYLGNPHMHQTWAWHASKFAKIINIGLNAFSLEEELEIKSNPSIICTTPEEFLEADRALEKPVHLSIDVDAFDPAYVVTGLPEGRLKPEQSGDSGYAIARQNGLARSADYKGGTGKEVHWGKRIIGTRRKSNVAARKLFGRTRRPKIRFLPQAKESLCL